MARADVEEIRCTTLINPVKVPDWPFRWTINTYRGCRHACRYCYARSTHEFLGLGTGRQFEQRVFAKVNAPEVLRSELRRSSWKREPIAMGTASDPYEPAEASYKLTRKVLGVMKEFANPVSITTKGVLVQRDIDVLQELSQVADVRVNFSIGCLDEEVWRATEPGAPSPRHRLEAMQALVEAGIHAGVVAAPIIPGLSDSEESLDELVGAAAAHKAQYLGGNVCFSGQAPRNGSCRLFASPTPTLRPSMPTTTGVPTPPSSTRRRSWLGWTPCARNGNWMRGTARTGSQRANSRWRWFDAFRETLAQFVVPANAGTIYRLRSQDACLKAGPYLRSY